ncbi:MAG TPA: hypothetical protein ENN41_11400 [Sediminispirochaeta sp.]|nr:hypothetical protein [Sediminispirochaeta sp.]
MKMSLFLRLSSVGILVLVLFSCATGGGRPTDGAAGAPEKMTAPEVSGTPMYYASGSGQSQTEALNRAKMNAVRKAVQDALGLPTAMAKKAQIEELFSYDKNSNSFVINSSTEILDRSQQDGSHTVSLGVRVNLEPVSNLLRANDVYGNQVLPQGGGVELPDQQRPSYAQDADEQDVTEKDTSAAGPEEQKVAAAEVKEQPLDPEKARMVQDIIDRMVYMVYYNEESVPDSFLATTAVSMANKYLSQNGFEYVDMDQVEQIKEDQMAAYEAETGQGISVLQWIAGKLNADIYIEVSIDTQSEQRDGRYYGSASVTLKNFDASTGSGRGTAFYQTVPPAMSTVSTSDAVNNAVASATYKAIEEALRQAENYTAKELRNGIKYELVLQNTSDSRVMRDFVRRMERKVESISRLSYSPAEAKYEVRLIGDVRELEDIIYDVSESVAGLEGLYLVYQRGNSITFNTGM